MFGLGCSRSRGARVSPEDTDSPPWASPQKAQGEEPGAPGMCSGGSWGQSQGDTAWGSPGVSAVHMGGKAVTTAARNLVLVGTKHSGARAALVTHITKIVFTGFINLHLYSCEWQVLVSTTHGRHPRWSSFSVFVYNSVKRHTKCQLPNQIWAL